MSSHTPSPCNLTPLACPQSILLGVYGVEGRNSPSRSCSSIESVFISSCFDVASAFVCAIKPIEVSRYLPTKRMRTKRMRARFQRRHEIGESGAIVKYLPLLRLASCYYASISTLTSRLVQKTRSFCTYPLARTSKFSGLLVQPSAEVSVAILSRSKGLPGCVRNSAMARQYHRSLAWQSQVT